jgi:hypothetical protein
MMLLLALFACAQPLHLQYDGGRALSEIAELQANLDRPSVANATYELSGTEGVKLRQNVESSTTEEKSGDATSTEKVAN